jgi:hypothetical protein
MATGGGRYGGEAGLTAGWGAGNAPHLLRGELCVERGQLVRQCAARVERTGTSEGAPFAHNSFVGGGPWHRNAMADGMTFALILGELHVVPSSGNIHVRFGREASRR